MGRCRAHRNEAERRRYAEHAEFRFYRRQRASMRRRGVDAVPPSGEELLLEAYDGKCAYCGVRAETWDHIIPVSKGGVTDLWNIVPACKSCNSSKGSRDVYEWMVERGVSEDRSCRITERLIMEHLPLSHHATNLVPVRR